MNNNNYNPIKDIQKKRRLKYGAFAVALTAAVIALVIVINAIFTALCVKNGWFIDMTEQDIYTPDPNALELLEEYRGSEEFNVTFFFCMEEDQLTKNERCNMVYNALKIYDEEYDFIKVECIDINKNPQALDRYLNNNASRPTSTSVIVTNGESSLVFSINTFFVSDGTSEGIYALNADKKIVSAIMRLSGDAPIAYFVTGHGEDDSPVLRTLFEDAGYKVENIDMTKGEKFKDGAKVVVINNPKYDFGGANHAVNEIDMLDKYLDGYASLMVFSDKYANELPVLDEFLAQWGIRFERKSVIDTESCVPGSLGHVIYAKYATEGNGAKITESLRKSSYPPKPIITNACPITLVYDEEIFTNNGAARTTSSVLVTTSAAETYDPETLKTTKGAVNLMTLTVQSYLEDTGTDRVWHNSYVLAGGTDAFSEDQYINGSTYANRDILYNAMKLFGKDNVPVGIRPKIFSNDALTITAEEANRWTAICTVMFPAIVAGIGIFVYARRRYL